MPVQCRRALGGFWALVWSVGSCLSCRPGLPSACAEATTGERSACLSYDNDDDDDDAADDHNYAPKPEHPTPPRLTSV